MRQYDRFSRSGIAVLVFVCLAYNAFPQILPPNSSVIPAIKHMGLCAIGMGIGMWCIGESIRYGRQNERQKRITLPIGIAMVLSSAGSAILIYNYSVLGYGVNVPSVANAAYLLSYIPLLIMIRQMFVSTDQSKQNQQADEVNSELLRTKLALQAENASLAAANAQLLKLAVTDSLTGLANRRPFQELLDHAMRSFYETQLPSTVMLIDVDAFKAYNDAFGHLSGDLVLKEIAGLIEETTPPGGIAARFGGEEFAILLPQVDSDEAYRIACDLQQRISGYPFPDRSITVSIGVASIADGHNTTTDWIAAADAALYCAKNRGRNRVVLRQDPIDGILSRE